MSQLYIGLMSGTSIDGIDAALVDFNQSNPIMLGTHYAPYSSLLRQQILSLCEQGDNEIERLGELDIILGKAFAKAVKNLLEKQSVSASQIKAIGSHGQTIRHSPRGLSPFTLQIADPNLIAAETGITTIADFRRKDIALGGQGAPLVPAFHHAVLTSKNCHRAIVNIGGIANVTFLPCNNSAPIVGFDAGPGNVLMDAWMMKHQQKHQDSEGAWGAQGSIHQVLLKNLLADPYFSLLPPKSTGREYFNLTWLEKHIEALCPAIQPVDVQATLAELTASTVMRGIRDYLSEGEVLICGGGAYNTYLMQRLQKHGEPFFSVSTTEKAGLLPDWIEAIAFAWLAKQTMNRCTGNLPSVTGASKAAILGGIYFH